MDIVVERQGWHHTTEQVLSLKWVLQRAIAMLCKTGMVGLSNGGHVAASAQRSLCLVEQKRRHLVWSEVL